MTVTDVTNLTHTQLSQWDDKARVDPWGWHHRHPMNVPYDVVRRGILSCNEQAPHGEMNFLVAAGREYLVAFYDLYDDFVTGKTSLLWHEVMLRHLYYMIFMTTSLQGNMIKMICYMVH